MILHQIEALARAGVTDVVLAVNYRPELMAKSLEPYEKELGVKIHYSRETEPLGTAGPLALARELLQGNKPFIVLNSDITCLYPFDDLIKFHLAHGKEGTIMVTKVEEPSKYGVVVMEDSGRIKRFVEKPKVFVGNKINAGIYIFNSSILDRIELRPTSIEKEIFPVMAEKGELYAMELKGHWMDVGQPKDFIKGTALQLNAMRSREPATLASGEGFVGPVLLSSSATIGKGCLIGPNVVIGANVVVEDGVRLANCTLMAGCRIRSHAWIKDSIIGWDSVVGRWTRVDNVSVLGEDVHIADELYINGARILPHKEIKETIALPTIIM